MSCDTCFRGYFERRYRWQQSLDPMTLLNLHFDAGQGKVRSSSDQIFKSIFLYKRHMFLAQNFLRIPNMSLVFLYDARTSKNRKSKNGVINFSPCITNIFSIGNIGFVCDNCIRIQSNHKTV